MGFCRFRVAAVAAVVASAFLASGSVARAAPIDCGGPLGASVYSFTGSMVTCQVMSSGTYSLVAYGANGGNQRIDALAPTTFGGLGASIGAYFALLAGDQLQILGGWCRPDPCARAARRRDLSRERGGGTFVTIVRNGSPAELMLAAGGGGGAGWSDCTQSGGAGAGGGGGFSGVRPHRSGQGWCRVRDLNPRPSVYKTAALPLC